VGTCGVAVGVVAPCGVAVGVVAPCVRIRREGA